MRKALFVLLTILSLCISKRVAAQRNIPGQVAAQVTVGLVDGFTFKTGNGLYRGFAEVGIARTNRNSTRWAFGVGFLQKDYLYDGYKGMQRIPKVQFTAEAGYIVPLFRDKSHTACLSAGASALAGYETCA